MKFSIGTTRLVLALPLFLAGVYVCGKSVSTAFNTQKSQILGQSDTITEGEVLAETTSPNSDFVFTVNVPARFANDITVSGLSEFVKDISAPNVLYSLTAGKGVSVSSGQRPTITNTGVTSLQSKTGDLTLSAGDGISLDGLKISNTGILSLSAGGGISVDGNKVTNSDTGSSQSIFKKIAVSGQDDVEADSNTDTLTLVAGSGLSITTSASGDSLTITPNDPSVAAGWTHTTGSVALTTSTDNVSIGGGLNANSSGITNAGSITGATGFTSSGTITLADLSTGIVHSNVYGVLSSSAVALGGSDVSGTLGTTNGGTGLTSYTAGDIIYASASNVLAKLGIGGDGEVLTVSGGVLDWGTINTSTPCPTCLVNNPGSDQTITPTAGTGLIVKKASSGTSDIFKVTNAAGSTAYLRIDTDGNVLLGNGQTTAGVLTISPTDTDPIAISPATKGTTAYTGTITSSDLTGARTWTFPDASGIVCTTSGNCSGSSSALGGNGTANYISKWSDTYSLTNSLLYDNGTNVGIGNASPGYKLDVSGTASVSGALATGDTFNAKGATTLQSTLNVAGTVDLASTLGVTGATTLSSTLGVTGNATFNGNLGIGTSPSYKLDVAGEGVQVARFGNTAGGNTTYINIAGTTYGLFLGFDYNGGSLTNRLSSTTDWRFNVSNAGSFTGGTTAMYLGTTGKVGIGTTSPTSKFHVSGAITGKALAILDETGDQNILVASASGTNRMTLSRTGGLTLTSSSGNAITASVTGSNMNGIRVTNTTNYNTIFMGTDHGNKMMLSAEGNNDFYVSGGNIGYGNNSPYIHFVNGAGINFKTESATGDLSFLPGGASTAKVFFEDTGKVGIGTTSPTSLLHVTGAVAGKSLAIFDETGDQNILVASASGTNKLVIKNDGSVGVGTVSPRSKLHIEDSYIGLGDLEGASGVPSTLDRNTVRGAMRFLGIQYSDQYLEIAPAASTVQSINAGYGLDLSLGKAAHPASNFTVSMYSDEKFRITYYGNTGIGTASPISKLHVSGAVTGKALTVFDETGDQNILVASASGTTKFILDRTGKVSMGTTSAPTNNVVVGGMSSTPGIKFLSTGFEIGSTSGYSNRIALSGTTLLYNASYNNSSSDGHIFQVDYGTEVMRIMGGGPHVGIGTSSPTGMFNVSGAIKGKALVMLDETGDQPLLTASASGTTKLTVLHNGLVNASAGGLATYTKAGTISDTDFADTAVDGLMAFDSTDGRLYIRNGGSWSYIAKTAGFQIPDYESTGLSEGDFLMPYVEKKMADGAVHGLYTKFSEAKGLLFADENNKIASLEQKLDILASATPSGEVAGYQTEVEKTLISLSEEISAIKDKLTSLMAKVTAMAEEFFTKKSHQEELCVGKSGEETCITKDQLDWILKTVATPSASSVSEVSPTPAPTSTPEPTPVATTSTPTPEATESGLTGN